MNNSPLKFLCRYGKWPVEECLSVSAFAFQEPENDPRNDCYLWVAHCDCDNSYIENPGINESRMRLYSLTYSQKEWLEDSGMFYRGFVSCSLRFEHVLGMVS